MVLGYNNMNMFNMYGNNGFGNLLQQGLNMFGGGYGMGNTSFFTNCYGEVNYDKMAGFQVANALLGTTFQAIAANKANKASEPEVNYTKELNAVAKEINTKEVELSVKMEEQSKLDSEAVQDAKELADLRKSLPGAKAALTKAKTDFDKVKNNTSDSNYDAYNQAYEDAKANVENIEREIKILEDKTKQQEADIEAKAKEVDAIKQKIAELKDKQASLQKTANEKTIEGHKSSPLLRAREKCIDEWADEKKVVDPNTKSASKAELEKAFYEFKKGGKDKTPAAKKKAATAFTKMYSSLVDEKMKNSFKSINTAVAAWLKENS